VDRSGALLYAPNLPGAVGTDLGGRSGVLIGSGERRPDGTPWTIKAVTVSSVKWPHLGSDDALVLRASVGRFGDTESLNRDDDELVAAVRSDLAALLGLEAEPLETVVARWGGGLPQYGVGHGDRVAAIERAVAAVPGLAVAGAVLVLVSGVLNVSGLWRRLGDRKRCPSCAGLVAGEARLCKHCGYRFEGVLRSVFELREKRVDSALYSRLPTDI